jgi:hypothetical protein
MLPPSIGSKCADNKSVDLHKYTSGEKIKPTVDLKIYFPFTIPIGPDWALSPPPLSKI